MSASTSVPDAELPRTGSAAFDSAMLDALLAQSEVAFACIDDELKLRRVSRYLAEMIGTTPAEQIGRTPAEAWPPALAASAESALRKVLADGMTVNDSLPGGRANGSATGPAQSRQSALTCLPSHGPDGTATGGTMIGQ